MNKYTWQDSLVMTALKSGTLRIDDFDELNYADMVDDRGNPPRVRRLHVCKSHGKAYCPKRKCVKQIKKILKKKGRK